MSNFGIGARGRSVGIGRVVAGTARELQRDWLLLIVLGLVFVALPNAGLSFIEHAWQPPKLSSNGALGLFIGDHLVSLLLESWFFAAAIHHATRPPDGRRAAWLQALGVGAQRVLPVFIVRLAGVVVMVALPMGTLFALAVGGRGWGEPSPASLFLIGGALAFPGALLFLSWCLAPVIVMAGRLGPIEALRRSWRLTAGSRLQIAVVWLLYLLTVALAAILILIAMAMGHAIIPSNWMPNIWGVLTSLPASILAVAVAISLWRELAGPAPEAVAAMFE